MSEYWEKCTFNLNELGKASEAHRVVWSAARNNTSQNAIQSALNAVGATTTVLAMMFANISTLGISTGLFALISQGLATNYFKNSLEEAYDNISKNFNYFFANSSKYRQVEFSIAFVEYNVGGERVRYAMRATSIERFQLNDGTWISAT